MRNFIRAVKFNQSFSSSQVVNTSQNVHESLTWRTMPGELLDVIFSYLHGDYGPNIMEYTRSYHQIVKGNSRSSKGAFIAAQASFTPVLHVCRCWYYAAIPHLYRYPSIKNRRNLQALVRTLCAQSELVGYPRFLYCMNYRPEDKRKTIGSVASSYTLIASFIEVCPCVEGLHIATKEGIRLSPDDPIISGAISSRLKQLSLMAAYDSIYAFLPSSGHLLLEELEVRFLSLSHPPGPVRLTLPSLRRIILFQTAASLSLLKGAPSIVEIELYGIAALPDHIVDTLDAFASNLQLLCLVGRSEWTAFSTLDLLRFSSLRTLIIGSQLSLRFLSNVSPVTKKLLPSTLRHMIVAEWDREVTYMYLEGFQESFKMGLLPSSLEQIHVTYADYLRTTDIPEAEAIMAVKRKLQETCASIRIEHVSLGSSVF
jgi:hypothetical protein